MFLNTTPLNQFWSLTEFPGADYKKNALKAPPMRAIVFNATIKQPNHDCSCPKINKIPALSRDIYATGNGDVAPALGKVILKNKD